MDLFHLKFKKPKNLPKLAPLPAKVQITQKLGSMVCIEVLPMSPNPISLLLRSFLRCLECLTIIITDTTLITICQEVGQNCV
jgi:hypothetical protein